MVSCVPPGRLGNNMNKQNLLKTEIIFIEFVLASFTGWVYEIIATYVVCGGYYDRGILHLPMCPIYGFGMLILLYILSNVKNPFALFVLSGGITTGFELICSYVLEYYFHMELWTYEPWPLNFQGRISLVSSAVFGLLALIFIKEVAPLTDKLCHAIKPALLHGLLAVFIVMCVLVQVSGLVC